MPAYNPRLFSPPAPVAAVVVRNQESGVKVVDVPMLLDSGADVTLIPRTSADLLGLSLDAGESYELVGFDGSVSQARAVQLDLIFLQRVFKGRFLVIDQEWGIVGRDVLNHLALVFDGPQLAWNEHRPPTA